MGQLPAQNLVTYGYNDFLAKIHPEGCTLSTAYASAFLGLPKSEARKGTPA
jgi:hypothetical protein